MRKRKFTGIKKKILISAMLVLLMTIISLSVIVICFSNEKAYKDYYINSTEQMRIVSNAVNIFYEQIDSNIDMLATNPIIKKVDGSITTYKNTTEATSMHPSTNGGIEQEIYEIFEQYAKNHEGTSYVYLGTSDGGYIQWPEETTEVGFDPTTEPWYIKAMGANGNIIRTEPYEYKSQMITSNARTFTDDEGNILGAIGIDIHQSQISGILSNMKTGETGYTMMVHINGLIMADGNNADNNFKNINDINIDGLDQLLSEERSPFTVIMDEKEYIVNPYEIQGTDWILGSFISKDELESNARKIVSTVALSAVIIFIIAFALLSYVAKSITKPIVLVTNRIGEFSNLDFSFYSKYDVSKFVNRNDEVGSMVRALNVMRDNVANFIINTSEAAEHVAASSEELTATSLEAATASEEIAVTIEGIAKGAEEQARDTEETSHNIEEMGSLIEQNFKHLKELNDAAMQIERQKEEGFIIISNLIDHNKSNNDASNEVYQIILSNNESVEKIDIASSMINDIATQTNLLALNAAIEAARAGEAGKGFAVVADQIRKLADESNKFTNDIKLVISELKDKSQNAMNLMQQSKDIVSKQTVSVEATEEKFESISQAIDVTKNIIDKLNYSAELMESKKSKVIELTQNLAAISEENSAGTEEASATMKEQAATIDEIAKSGEGLAKIAEELKQVIEKFKI
ncbi:HAMP domain-containing protein [Defluviitalea raffinosedens]|uniref:HAMP domain-containing protein n=1 Tax=Defluviitalea raffinosedens TaxID=1450156 RepID=A0A7C8LCK3_9FIRM|nr:methyl-accepting chemotaxis protein [Defluviitalea raffinosedens]KAE9628369.1 HAMP domain-containing protein [Defluviitalea raffinosedens]